MKLRFNGMISQKSGGCSVCGHKSKGLGIVTTKTFILPSGITKTFRVGKCEEVKEKDAEFLLSYQYEKDGQIQKVFEVCNG